jgi:hypothetical protein
MDLTNLILTGSLAGLVSVLAQSIAWTAFEFVRAPTAAAASKATLEYSEAFLHMLSGSCLGLLFWLSWGLAAVVEVPWWVRGVSFGSLCWLALALPVTIGVARAHGVSPSAVALLATRWGTTCLAAALACAWNWENGM